MRSRAYEGNLGRAGATFVRGGYALGAPVPGWWNLPDPETLLRLIPDEVPWVEAALSGRAVKTITARNEDGTLDIVQRAPSRVSPSCGELELLYWREVEGVTLGLMRFSGGAIRFLGLWPVVLRFGPVESGRRAIVGGLFARPPFGSIEWRAREGEVLVAVRGFSPRLGGPFLRAEQWFHGLVGKRFLANATRGEL